MANNCYYEMKVKGEKQNTKDFILAMQGKGEYENLGVGRIYSCEIIEETKNFVILTGDCAWSIASAMRNFTNKNNIEELSKRLNLEIEVYSEEVGCQFQEHFCVVNGVVQCDECVDFIEVYIEDVSDLSQEFWNISYIKKLGVTKDNYQDYVVDDYLRIGGYKTWDWIYV